VGAQAAEVGHSEARERHLAVQGLVPRDLVGGVHASVGVVRVNHLEAGLLQALKHVLGGGEGGQAVADLDSLLDADVVLVVGVVLVGDDPLVSGEQGALLQHARDTAEGHHAVGGVAGGLDLVGGVEVLSGPGELLEVSLDQLALVAQAVGLVVFISDFNLVVVNGDALNGSTREHGNVAHGAANTASNVKHLHSGLEAEATGQVILSALDTLHEGLVVEARAEVETLSPAPLVEISHQVVEVVDHVSVLGLADLDRLDGGDGTGLVAGTSEHVLVVSDGFTELTLLQGVITVVQDLHTTTKLTVVIIAISVHRSRAEDKETGSQSGNGGGANQHRVLLGILGGLLHNLLHLLGINHLGHFT
jgi:hypothetical protein